MAEKTITTDELRRFRKIIELGESHIKIDKVSAQISMISFVSEVGKEKCEAMFEILKAEFNEAMKADHGDNKT